MTPFPFGLLTSAEVGEALTKVAQVKATQEEQGKTQEEQAAKLAALEGKFKASEEASKQLIQQVKEEVMEIIDEKAEGTYDEFSATTQSLEQKLFRALRQIGNVENNCDQSARMVRPAASPSCVPAPACPPSRPRPITDAHRPCRRRRRRGST